MKRLREKWKKSDEEMEEHLLFMELPVKILPLISGKGDEL